MTLSLIARAKRITGATNDQLAKLLGIGESTVQAYDRGRLPERLTPEQVTALVEACRRYVEDVTRQLEELEMFG